MSGARSDMTFLSLVIDIPNVFTVVRRTTAILQSFVWTNGAKGEGDPDTH